jgi:hypothetical protein
MPADIEIAASEISFAMSACFAGVADPPAGPLRRARSPGARLHRQREILDLRAGVVVVELAYRVPAIPAARRVAQRRLPAVAIAAAVGWRDNSCTPQDF